MGLDLKKIARAYLASICVWCCLSLLTGWQYRIFDQQLNIHSSMLDMILLAESRGFAFALLTPPIFYLVRRWMDDAKSIVSHLWVYALGLGPFMVLYACIRWLVLPPWDAALQQYVPRTAHGPFELIYSGFADQITMYIAIVVAGYAYEYFRRVRAQQLEKFEYQQALAASELQALKMQLQPHFLFNTLHGISTLIENDPENARAMILKLSRLLRTALDRASSDLIPLAEELKFVAEYLELEKMRFGPRLTVVFSVAAGTETLLVPHMILQPLVENAIRYGISVYRESGSVGIEAERIAAELELKVRNTVGNASPPGMGVGLKNTQARLRHLYGEEASLSFAIDENRTATAMLKLPALSSEPHIAAAGTGESESEAENHACADRG